MSSRFLYISVVTPKPECDPSPPASSFSVTGFLTFSVVAATSLANIISNINNNNNNNNDNNNNENQNDNNQISNNAMMEGRKRKRSMSQGSEAFSFCDKASFNEGHYFRNGLFLRSVQYISKQVNFCPEKYICNAIEELNLQQNHASKRMGIFMTTFSAFILSDIFPTITHETALYIIQNATAHHNYCLSIKC